MEEAELEVLLKPILELYTQIEIELLENIASRFDTYPTIDGSLEWYLDKMQELGAFKQTNVKIMAKYAGLSSKELKHLMEELVFRSALEFKGADLNALLNSTANRNTLTSILNNLENDIKIINTKALESAEKSYIDILTKSTIEVTSGVHSFEESIKHGLLGMSQKGIYGATYARSNGKVMHYSLEGTVRRDVLTRAHQVAFETQLNNLRELGHNLVYVSQHEGARVHKTNLIANHAGWQGKVYMLDGSSSKYPNLIEATGYGDIQGLAGVNCRHHISSYIEGVTKLPTRIDEEENERIYQESQEQRRLERDVRKAKKELAVAKKIDDKDLIKKAQGKLKQRTEKLNGFIDGHPDMHRDYARTRIGEEYVGQTENGKNVSIKKSTKEYAAWNGEKDFENELQKHGDLIYSKLNDDEREAIAYYTDAGSSVFNESLATGSVMYPEDIRDEKILSSIIERSTIGKDIMVYSGLSYPEGFAGRNTAIGEIFTSKVYTSASIKKSVGEEFAEYGENEYGQKFLLEINLPANAKALYLGDNSWSKQKDFELIINKNTKYKVISRDTGEDGMTVIKLEVI